MAEFVHQDLLPLGPDTTEYRLLTTDGVEKVDTEVGSFLRVSSEAITTLTSAAMFEIAHFLRAPHLAQLAKFSTTLRHPETTGSLRSICCAMRTLPPAEFFLVAKTLARQLSRRRRANSFSPPAMTRLLFRGRLRHLPVGQPSVFTDGSTRHVSGNQHGDQSSRRNRNQRG